MYRIFIKYTSTFKKTFWYEHQTTLEDGTTTEFSTSDLEVLKNEIKKLDEQIGTDSIRIVNDISYDVLVNVTETGDCNHDVATTEDVENIYNTAFNNVFGGG